MSETVQKVQTKTKPYNGYKSFQYLEPGEDYKPYKLAKEIGRVEPFTYPLSEEQEKEVQVILEDELIISLHEHTFVCPENVGEIFEFRRQGRDWTGYEGLSVSGLDVVFENYMDGTAMITSNAGWKWNDVIHDLGIRYSDFAHQDLVIRADTIEDIYRSKREGKIAFVTSLESATQIENEIDRVDVLYGLGVRVMGIAYSEANALGSGLKEKNDSGLTVFGHKVVKRMNKLGMTIDVSHCGDKTAMDVIEASEKPIFITHVGSRALWNTNRMKPDYVFEACAAKGGVIGIEAAPHTTLTANHPEHSIESVMEHFEHVVKLVGIDHVAFGLDTLYGDHVGLHHVFANALSIGESHAGVDFEEVSYVKGLENPSEAYPNVVRWLVNKGYSREDIRKVMGENIMRVLKETWVK
ncbi:dipeptidase [Bacillus sp. B-jedd]|uniref:dipeptidase n=1 Tax=Bacillus sp. B-jedd TaxID=1476857 RepID=UPI00051559FF|nr:membrane dipeptidase [Bacillus sp. B-jedd]CEG28712.1 peptidase M19 renal dipeptidase [Bacillus sp. B-jedd]